MGRNTNLCIVVYIYLYLTYIGGNHSYRVYASSVNADESERMAGTCQRYDGIVCAAVLATQLVHIPSNAYQINVEHKLIGESVYQCIAISLSVLSHCFTTPRFLLSKCNWGRGKAKFVQYCAT